MAINHFSERRGFSCHFQKQKRAHEVIQKHMKDTRIKFRNSWELKQGTGGEGVDL